MVVGTRGNYATYFNESKPHMSIQTFGPARLGRDSELRYTPDGTAVTNLSLAFTYGRKGADGKRETTWVDASLWGKLAEALAPYLLKGSLVAVTIDDMHIEQFKKADGTPGVKLAGKVTSIDLASSPAAASPAPPPPPRPAPPARPPAPAASHGFEDMDSDIPF